MPVHPLSRPYTCFRIRQTRCPLPSHRPAVAASRRRCGARSGAIARASRRPSRCCCWPRPPPWPYRWSLSTSSTKSPSCTAWRSRAAPRAWARWFIWWSPCRCSWCWRTRSCDCSAMPSTSCATWCSRAWRRARWRISWHARSPTCMGWVRAFMRGARPAASFAISRKAPRPSAFCSGWRCSRSCRRCWRSSRCS